MPRAETNHIPSCRGQLLEGFKKLSPIKSPGNTCAGLWDRHLPTRYYCSKFEHPISLASISTKTDQTLHMKHAIHQFSFLFAISLLYAFLLHAKNTKCFYKILFSQFRPSVNLHAPLVRALRPTALAQDDATPRFRVLQPPLKAIPDR